MNKIDIDKIVNAVLYISFGLCMAGLAALAGVMLMRA